MPYLVRGVMNALFIEASAGVLAFICWQVMRTF